MKKIINLIVFVLLVPFFVFSCNKNNSDEDLLVYDHKVVQYNLPISGYDVNKLTVSSSNPDLFTVSKVSGSNNEVLVESNLNNLAGSGEITFTYNNEPVKYKLNVNVKHPSNIQEAMDAFTLAAIKVPNNTDFKVTFAFNNKLDDYNFELSQEIYGRMGATHFVNYSTGNRTNTFRVNTKTSYATTKSGMEEGDEYYFYNPNNINYLNHQGSSAHTFYIDTINRTLDVSNSEELFWAVEHGYRPIISASDTKLNSIYNQARDLCLNIINPSKTEFENFRILFEALESKTHYDYWVLEQSSYWFTYTSYFLEGVFLDNGKAVCDGFSKAYALLCGIEGLPCIRSYGFSNDGGHAWNYIKLNGSWYLACPTWCKAGFKYDDDYIINLMDYDAFATSKNYFKNSGSDFSDLAFTTYNKSSSPYCSTSNLSLDKTSGDSSFYISNDSDASKVNTIVKNKITGSDAYVCIAYPTGTSSITIQNWASTITSGVGSKGYKHYSIITPTYVSTTYTNAWIYITKS